MEDASDLRIDVRDWALHVRMLAKMLLSLGRRYEVHYDLTNYTTDVSLASLGLDMTSIMKTNLLQVTNVIPSTVPYNITSRSSVGTIGNIMNNDYLVGVNDEDLVLLPINAKRLSRAFKFHLDKLESHNSRRVLKLAFVRLDALVCVDPVVYRTHGSVLERLEDIDNQHKVLVDRYAHLLERNRQVINKELVKEYKLLHNLQSWARSMKTAVYEDGRFRFAVEFQTWLSHIYREPIPSEKDQDEEGDKQQDVILISDSDDEKEREVIDDEMNEEEDEGPRRPARGYTPKPSFADDESDDAPPKPPTPPRPSFNTPHTIPSQHPQRSPPPLVNVDMSWLRRFPQQEYKWLKVHIIESFMKNITSAFLSDHSGDDERDKALSVAIGEQFLRHYIHKRHQSVMNDDKLRKEASAHLRYLLSNIKRFDELRNNLRDGYLDVVKLCHMSAQELAPEAMRLEREKRFEQNAKNNTLEEPTGRAYIKRKEGFREVVLGNPNGSPDPEPDEPSQDSQETLQTAANESEMEEKNDVPMDVDYAEDSAMVREADAPPPPQSTHVPPRGAPAPPSGILKRQGSNKARGRKTISFNPSNEYQTYEESLRSAQENLKIPNVRSVEAQSKQMVPDVHRLCRPEEGKQFLATLLGSTYDLQDSLIEFAKTAQAGVLPKNHHEIELATGVSLYRHPKGSHQGMYKTTLRIAHLFAEGTGTSDGDATTRAADALQEKLVDCRRTFVTQLEEVKVYLNDAEEPDIRKRERRLKNTLAERRLIRIEAVKVTNKETGADEMEAIAAMNNLPLTASRSKVEAYARNDANDAIVTFLKHLASVVDLGNVPTTPVQRVTRPPEQPTPHASYRQENRSHYDARSNDYYRSHRGYDDYRSHEYYASTRDNRYSRKRQYPEDSYLSEEEPASSRQRVDDGHYDDCRERMDRCPEPSYKHEGIHKDYSMQEPLSPSNGEPIGFVVDTQGEERRRPDEPSKEKMRERQERAEVAAYQALVRVLAKEAPAVVRQIESLSWDETVPTQQEALLTSELHLSRTIEREEKTYKCTIYLCENEHVKAEASCVSLDAAKATVMSEFQLQISRMRTQWNRITDTYDERVQKGSTTLMAAHEAKQKHHLVLTEETKRLALYHQVAFVIDGRTVVRAACPTAKEAGRSAREDLQRLLADFSHLRKERQAPPPTQDTPTDTSTLLATARPTAEPEPPQPSAPSTGPSAAMSEPSQMITCSDDDDDDDEFGNYSDSGESDWEAESTAKDNGSTESMNATETVTPGRSFDAQMTALGGPYDPHTEVGETKDAKFRALLRGLLDKDSKNLMMDTLEFTRGELKYKGALEKKVCANVNVKFQVQRIQGNTHDVFIQVNDVMTIQMSAKDRMSAVGKAITKLVEHLNALRTKWINWLLFFDTKFKGSSDLVGSFRTVLVLNRLTMDVIVETPLEGPAYYRRQKEAYFRVDNYVVYQCLGASDSAVREEVTHRAIAYLVHLCAMGNQEAEAAGDVSMDQEEDKEGLSWNLQLRLEQLGSKDEEEYTMNAIWAKPESMPLELDFPTADAMAVQVDSRPVRWFERLLHETHASPFCFKMKPVFNEQKFMKLVSTYGNKSPNYARVLELRVDHPNRPYRMFIVPPSASINSDKNRYWPKAALSKWCEFHSKDVVGLLLHRNLL